MTELSVFPTNAGRFEPTLQGDHVNFDEFGVENWPRISVVTPSFNQAEFLEATIRSILSQAYPNLEYIIIDGGSNDGSRDIIQEFEKDLAYWVSEPDGGLYAALNKGFGKATGDILCWLNSDDLHCPWTLRTVATIMRDCPHVEWLSSLFPMTWDRSGLPSRLDQKAGFASAAILDGRYMPGPGNYGYIQQESTFWRRSLWERSGAIVPTEFGLAGDFGLWVRFARYAELYAVNVPLAGFRFREGQRSRIDGRYRDDVENAAKSLFVKRGSRLRELFAFGPLRNVPMVRRFLFKAISYRGHLIQRVNPGSRAGRQWESSDYRFL